MAGSLQLHWMVPLSKSHNVLGIAPVAIIDRQLPFEYTIASISTDVMVMAQPIQNINHLVFKSMLEREKLSGTNFNDWFRQLKLVLRVEKKMYVIEQPIPPTPAANFEAQVLAEWNAVYDAHNEVACLMLKIGVERFDLIQTFHAYKQEEGKPVGAYVLQMKGYVEQLERLGYVIPQDLSIGLILNGLTSDFAGFVRNYNMHNMGKKIGEMHALLIDYENGLPKKVDTLHVIAIQGGRIHNANKKSQNAKGKGKGKGKGNDKPGYIPKPKNPKPSAKEHPAKDDTCHHCQEVYDTGCGTHICNTKYGLRGVRKLKQGALYLYVGNGVRAQVEAIGSFNLVLPNGLDYALESAARILNMVPTKKVDKKPYELWYGKVPNLSYLKETMGYYFYFPPKNKIVVARYAEFLEKNLLSQEVNRRAVELEETQDEDTSPSENTSEIHVERFRTTSRGSESRS
ncbi:hypothetical protein Tco_1311183 [Tanacetum coccineum]